MYKVDIIWCGIEPMEITKTSQECDVTDLENVWNKKEQVRKQKKVDGNIRTDFGKTS